MHAIRFHEFGGEDRLRYEAVADPVPGPGEVVVRVRACGVNHLDLDLRRGTSRFPVALPHVLGMEFSGEVVAVGTGVTTAKVGDRVMASAIPCETCRYCRSGRDNLCPEARHYGVLTHGAYAGYVKSPARGLLPVPPGLGFEAAAAIQIAFGTAWHMLIVKGGLRAGEEILINGAGSGVGSAGIQVACHAGARVIATGGSDEKLERAKALGAQAVINYHREPLAATVLALTGGRGVDLVFEHVGGDLFIQSLACLAPDGRLVTCGAHAGEVVPLDIVPLFRRQQQIIGSRRGTRQEVETVADLVARGVFAPVIHGVYPLRDAPEVHRIIAERRQFGKLVLVPEEE